MREDPACSCNVLFRAIATPVAALTFWLMPFVQTVDAAKEGSRPEHRWFVFLGGSSDKPVWTVCRGGQYQGLPPLYVDQIGAFTPIVEAALGVQLIVVSTNISPASSQTPSDIPQRVDPAKLSAEELSSTLLLSVRKLASASGSVVLELQTPLAAMFSDAYLSRYSEQPAVLSVSHRSQDAKLRLCRLTQELVAIAGLMQSEGQIIKPEVAWTTATDMAVIETAWRESILKPYGLAPLRLHVWESLSTIEVVFAEDVPFAGWAGVIAGKKLAGQRTHKRP